MTGGADFHTGNAARLCRWSSTGTVGACRIAAKMLRSGLRTRDQGGRPRSPAGQMTPVILRKQRHHGIPMTKPTLKSP
jgi:hypothetical protein